MTKKQSLGYYIGRMVLNLRRLLRQRGFVSFHLLFHATAQRASRCSLLSLRGRGWGEGHFYVFYYLCRYDFCPLCHYGLFYVNYFYHLTILSIIVNIEFGGNLPFLSRIFREEVITIKNTIVYKIKQRRRNSENHKFIYGKSTGKEVKERKMRYKKRGFVYIFHNKVIFLPYSSHLTS